MKKFFQKGNSNDARKARHERVFKEEESIFRAEMGRRTEKVFFWRVVSMATLGLFFFSIVPQFAVSEFRGIEGEMVQNDTHEEILFLEDGFLKKPEKWTEIGDRSDIRDILEYAIEEGDTLSAIAEKFGVEENTILQNNAIDKSALKVGSIIKIPATDGVVHKVQRGETIGAIAKKYNVDAEKIMAQNEIANGADLIAGEEIIIPGAKKIAPKPVYVQAPASAAGIPAGRETYGKLLFPTQGQYTQGYHYGHYAVDIAAAGGAPIWAAESGTVIRAEYGWNGGYGNVIIIDHGNGMQTLYAHNKELYVQTGDVVARGQPISYMGRTGRVYGRTGIHLHFEVRVNGQKMNPTRYF